jgi:hypothetical protein
MRTLPGLALGMIAFAPPAGLAAERTFFIEGGTYFSTGDFGTGEDTRVFALPLKVGVRSERLELSAATYYVRSSTTGFTTFSAGGPTFLSETPGSPVVADEASDDSTSGIGDVYLDASLIVLEENARRPLLAPWASLKLPTADEDEGLGTGEPDFGLGLLLTKSFESLFASLDVGYTFIGEPSGASFDDVVSAQLTVGRRLSQRMALYGLLDYRTAVVDEVDDPVALGCGMRYGLREDLGLRAELRVGLTETAADVDGLLSLVYEF